MWAVDAVAEGVKAPLAPNRLYATLLGRAGFELWRFAPPSFRSILAALLLLFEKWGWRPLSTSRKACPLECGRSSNCGSPDCRHAGAARAQRQRDPHPAKLFGVSLALGRVVTAARPDRRQDRQHGSDRAHLHPDQAGADADRMVPACTRRLRALAGGPVCVDTQLLGLALRPRREVARQWLHAARMEDAAAAAPGGVGPEAQGDRISGAAPGRRPRRPRARLRPQAGAFCGACEDPSGSRIKQPPAARALSS
jgi:hypothetical protein